MRIDKVPNILSALRLFSIPVLYWTFRNNFVFISSLVLVFVIVTDILDGYLARKYSAVSIIGTLLDHGADKLISIALSFLLYYFYKLPAWAFYFFVLRDLFITIFGLGLYLGFKLAFGSLWLGKVAGAFYYGMVFGYLLNFERFSTICMIISVCLFSLVLLIYPFKFLPIVKAVIFERKGGVKFDEFSNISI
ncbi:MAG: CDP-alcohol phosphatidyltransferase family protein [candidate division WOR-3 bacterium]